MDNVKGNYRWTLHQESSEMVAPYQVIGPGAPKPAEPRIISALAGIVKKVVTKWITAWAETPTGAGGDRWLSHLKLQDAQKSLQLLETVAPRVFYRARAAWIVR